MFAFQFNVKILCIFLCTRGLFRILQKIVCFNVTGTCNNTYWIMCYWDDDILLHLHITHFIIFLLHLDISHVFS